ncbi:unnamed protein product, partial [Brassica oleracea]
CTFQSLLIPFPHANASSIKEGISIESLVSDYYTLGTPSSAYAEDILPISNDMNPNGVTIEREGAPLEIFPPVTRRPPDRPHKSRILSTGEIRMKNPRKRNVCSCCKGNGHNKATCKVPI